MISSFCLVDPSAMDVLFYLDRLWPHMRVPTGPLRAMIFLSSTPKHRCLCLSFVSCSSPHPFYTQTSNSLTIKYEFKMSLSVIVSLSLSTCSCFIIPFPSFTFFILPSPFWTLNFIRKWNVCILECRRDMLCPREGSIWRYEAECRWRKEVSPDRIEGVLQAVAHTFGNCISWKCRVLNFTYYYFIMTVTSVHSI